MKIDMSTKFYNQMTEDYHLLFPHWDETVRSQGRSIKTLIQKYSSHSQEISVLDCSCGIGTQAIGLALEGCMVTGTDISGEEIDRAKNEAKRLGASLSFQVADFQRLADNVTGKFDVVLSFDNAIAHLNDLTDLKAAFSSMKERLNSKGVLLVSTRNNDELRTQKPSGTIPRTVEDQFGKRIIVQTWEWNTAGNAYELIMFIFRRKGYEWVSKSYSPVSMRAFNKQEINDVLSSLDAVDIKWFSTQESGYYQPVVMARFNQDNENTDRTEALR